MDHDASELANPRVGPSTTRGLGASSTGGVKFSGGHTSNSMQLNVTRKRAFPRARRRAEAERRYVVSRAMADSCGARN